MDTIDAGDLKTCDYCTKYAMFRLLGERGRETADTCPTHVARALEEIGGAQQQTVWVKSLRYRTPVTKLRRVPLAPARTQELIYSGQCQWCASEIVSTTGDDGSWCGADEEGALGDTYCPDSSNEKHEPTTTH